MRTSNPAMQAFVKPQTWDALHKPAEKTMTVGGTVNAALILTGICAAAAVAAYGLLGQNPTLLFPVAMGSCLACFIGGFIVFRNPRSAPYLTPIFAAGEGLCAGAISLMVVRYWPAIDTKIAGPDLIVQAVLLTLGILAATLIGFRLGLIRIGGTAMKVIMVATAGVVIYYLAGWLIGMFINPGYRSLGWSSGWGGIAFSAFLVILASLNLVMDFQFIEAGVARKAPRYMEWYGAFGLLVTLVWLYIETLRLLAKLQSRD